MLFILALTGAYRFLYGIEKLVKNHISSIATACEIDKNSEKYIALHHLAYSIVINVMLHFAILFDCVTISR